MNRRSRSACLTGALLTVLLTGGAAFADSPIPNEGVQSGDGLSPLETIALYILVPGAILLVIGGLASISGAFFGALFIQFIPNIADQISKAAPWAIYGVVLIAFMYLMPSGVVGLLRLVQARWTRRRLPASGTEPISPVTQRSET